MAYINTSSYVRVYTQRCHLLVHSALGPSFYRLSNSYNLRNLKRVVSSCVNYRLIRIVSSSLSLFFLSLAAMFRRLSYVNSHDTSDGGEINIYLSQKLTSRLLHRPHLKLIIRLRYPLWNISPEPSRKSSPRKWFAMV